MKSKSVIGGIYRPESAIAEAGNEVPALMWIIQAHVEISIERRIVRYARGLQGEFVDFRKHCGDQVVLVDVETDKGAKQYEFGGR